MANIKTSSGGSGFTKLEGLEAARLRQVQDHFGHVGSPRRMLSAAAIFRATKILTARMEAVLADYDLTTTRYELLGLLDNSEGGKLSLGQLGRTTMYHPATMTYTIDGLEKRKLIKRQPDPNDRRAVLAAITPTGRKVIQEATDALQAIDWGLADLTEEDAAALAVILSRIDPT